MAEILPGIDRASDAFKQTRAAVVTLLDGKVTFGFETTAIANTLAGIVFIIVFIPTIVFAALFGTGAFLASLFLQGIDDARKGTQDQLNTLTAAALSDVMGVEIKPGDLGAQGGGAGNAQLFTAIGSKIIGAITQELGGGTTATAGPGEQAAQAFMGRGVNFAMMSSVIAIVSEMASLGFIKEFAEIGEELQHSIGFGRLMRLVLQPIIHALVTLPYTREVNAKYHPVHLSAAEYLTAGRAGRMAQADVDQALSEAGYPPALAAELAAQHAHRLKVHEVDALIRWGKVAQDAGVAILVASGIDAATAQQMLDGLHLAEADREERAYAAEVVKLAQERMIDQDTFATLLGKLHLSDEEKQGIANRVGVYLESHHKPLTLPELIYLQEHNLITGDEITAWAEQQGYSPNDQAALDLYVTQKELDYQAAQAAKAAKAAAAAAKKKGTVPPPKS